MGNCVKRSASSMGIRAERSKSPAGNRTGDDGREGGSAQWGREGIVWATERSPRLHGSSNPSEGARRRCFGQPEHRRTLRHTGDPCSETLHRSGDRRWGDSIVRVHRVAVWLLRLGNRSNEAKPAARDSVQ
jgi:hypothetical protein